MFAGIQVITTTLGRDWRDGAVQKRFGLRLVENFDVAVHLSMLARPHLAESMWKNHATVSCLLLPLHFTRILLTI